MAIKSKRWTARRPVKICCVILIPVMMFLSLYGVFNLAKQDNNSIELLVADLNNSDYFYDKYIPEAVSNALTLFFMKSEANIRKMGCLKWRLHTGNEYRFNEYVLSDNWFDLVSVVGPDSWQIASIPEANINTSAAKQMVDDAIQKQLYDFNTSKNRLENTPGLSYLVTDGDTWVGNVPPDTDVSSFRWQQVFWIAENNKSLVYSRSNGSNNSQYKDYGYGNMFGYSYDSFNLSSYVSFSDSEVVRQNAEWRAVQRQIITQLIIIAASLIIAFASIIILMAGAGRKYPEESDVIHYLAIDKPWLDVGLCVLAFYEVIICYFAYRAMEVAWRYSNDLWIVALCGALSVFFTLPLLGWLLSFTKRCKAGKWWRYTLIYKFSRWVWEKTTSFASSLWAGFPLTLKVVLLGICLFVMYLLCIAVYRFRSAAPVLAFIFASIATFGMLRYSRRLFLILQGAKDASGGHYDIPIAVTGGELGSIAESINNISGGINDAVADRLKSERMKTELITNISHDIRTPITSLITYSDLLKSEGLDNERAPEYLDILIQKSARLKTLTDDLFEASKAASGNVDVHIEKLDFADLVRQVLGELDEKLRDSGLDFRLNLPEHAPVSADGRLLWRVTENLLSNVFKYAMAGSRVYVDLAPENGWYRLDIKNMSEHPLNVDPSELTERFKRGDEARGGDGSGLGLSIAQSFVLLQGGRFALSIDGDLFKASVYLRGF